MIIFGLTLSTIDLWLLGCCGGLIVLFLKLRFTADLRSRDIFNTASMQFRYTIYAELEGLYPTTSKWPLERMQIRYILKDKFPRIENAVHKFRGHLPYYRRKTFDAAWLQYHGGNDDYHNYWPYITTTSTNDGKQITEDTRNTYKETFKHNVDKLLSFAKQK